MSVCGTKVWIVTDENDVFINIVDTECKAEQWVKKWESESNYKFYIKPWIIH